MSTATPSPMSGGSSSEGSPLRAFVDETIAKDRQTAMSPRSAVLSHTSLPGPQPGHLSQSTAISPSAQGVVEKRRKAGKRSPGEHRKRATAPDLSLSSLSQLNVDRLKKDPKAEALRLRELLEVAVRQVHSESRRAADLERANQETATKFRVLNDNRLSAQQEAAKINTELRLQQVQLENAQKEIERAHDTMKEVERQRDEAEAEATRARAKARKLQQEMLIAAAREEGRRLGYEAGFDHAKKEREILASRRIPVALGPPPNRASTKGKQRAYEDSNRHRRSSQRPPRRQSDDIQSSPEYENFPSQLPLLGLPDIQQPGPSNSTPLHTFQPPQTPPDSESEREPTPPPQPSRPDPRSKTPSIQTWSITVPPQEVLDRSYNSLENPNDSVPQRPRNEWVTANKHIELRGTPSNQPHRLSQSQQSQQSLRPQPSHPQTTQPQNFLIPQFPNGQPPPLLPHPAMQPYAYQRPNVPPPSKAVKFPKLSRPSLAKTKQQASSWYRSLSFRKKNKPVIDPIPEEPSMTPTTGGNAVPLTASTSRDQTEPPTASTGPPDTGESNEYGPPPQPRSSWYKHSGVPPSVRSRDYAPSRLRPRSDASASTKMSQFDLLATPNIGVIPGMATSGKGAAAVREKDSFLSVIKEDPASRGNTPDRYGVGVPSGRTSTGDMRAFPQPNFGGGRQVLQHQGSFETLASSVQNKRRSRRPPSIAVPDPNMPLEPAGVAYARQSQPSLNGYQNYPSNTNLSRRPSRISEKTTPDTSIAIDVVPPSAFAPDRAQSPPHTGVNHLSPWHVFRPSQSTQSMRSQGGSAPPPRPPSVADKASRQRSNQTLNSAYGDRPPSSHSRAQSQSNPYGNLIPSSFHDLRSQGSNSPLRPPNPPFAGSASGRPESVRSGRSKRPPPRQASQSSFILHNPDPPSASGVSNDGHAAARPSLMLAPPLHRVASNSSMKSNGSYSKYDPTGYTDPAYWGVDGPDGPPAAIPALLAPIDKRISRHASVNSGLSYA